MKKLARMLFQREIPERIRQALLPGREARLTMVRRAIKFAGLAEKVGFESVNPRDTDEAPEIIGRLNLVAGTDDWWPLWSAMVDEVKLANDTAFASQMAIHFAHSGWIRNDGNALRGEVRETQVLERLVASRLVLDHDAWDCILAYACHLESGEVLRQRLSATPEIFQPSRARRVGAFLVGEGDMGAAAVLAELSMSASTRDAPMSRPVRPQAGL